MITLNDANLNLDKRGHDFRQDTINTITATAFETLIKRGLSGIFLVPLLFVTAACSTSYSGDYPILFLFLLLMFLICTAFRIVCFFQKEKNRTIWYTVYFVSSLGTGFLFGIYTASSIYLYGKSWTTTVVLFMLAAISGASIASFSVWKKLCQLYVFLLVGPTTVVSLFFCAPEIRTVGLFCLIACVYNYRQAALWNKNFWMAHLNVYLLENEISRHEKSRQKLLTERDKARQANMAKTDFLANMSHELRTPMHGILSYADFGIQRIQKVSSEKLLEYFYEIADSGNRLMILLNDLLDLAKLEAGKMKYTMLMQDMGLSISSVISEFQPVLEKKGLQLETFLPEFPLATIFDADRIGQVLRNLLSNSIKFSDSGKTISIKAEEKNFSLGGKDQSVIMVSVSDQGVGIPEGELESIFDKFIQSSKTKTGAGGTGLGLAICQQIVEEHKGVIQVKNNPEGGATFSFTCPVQRRKDDI